MRALVLMMIRMESMEVLVLLLQHSMVGNGRVDLLMEEEMSLELLSG